MELGGKEDKGGNGKITIEYSVEGPIYLVKKVLRKMVGSDIYSFSALVPIFAVLVLPLANTIQNSENPLTSSFLEDSIGNGKYWKKP